MSVSVNVWSSEIFHYPQIFVDIELSGFLTVGFAPMMLTVDIGGGTKSLASPETINVVGEVTRRRLRKHKPGLQSGPVLLLVSGLGFGLGQSCVA